MGWSAVPAPPHLMVQEDVMLAGTIDEQVYVWRCMGAVHPIEMQQ